MADKPEWKLNGQMLTMTFPLEETIVTIKVEEHTSHVYCTLHVGLKIHKFDKACPIFSFSYPILSYKSTEANIFRAIFWIYS